MEFIKQSNGTPDRIRTCDPRLRRPMLYPTELRALNGSTGGIRTLNPKGRRILSPLRIPIPPQCRDNQTIRTGLDK